MTKTIPVLELRGTHRQVGQQIGQAMKASIQKEIAGIRDDLPRGIAWDDMLFQSAQYLAPTRMIYPQYIEELEGIAEAAGVPFEEVFLEMCEELWESPAWRSGSRSRLRGCSDMAARGEATADGSTLLAHTNDLSPKAEEKLVILRIKAVDEPEILAVSAGGVGISAGFNAAGIALTGNQVDSNDLRPGVPRLVMVRALLAAKRLGEALNICLLPQRASNYNNILADANGEIYSMEGSATDCEPIYISENILSHANHYVSAPMRGFEADRSTIGDSVIRHNRAMRLLRENYGKLSPELFMTLLADHANYPASLCKHGLDSVTAFSIIIRLEQRRAWIGPGRPCQTTFTEYQLDPWPLTPEYLP